MKNHCRADRAQGVNAACAKALSVKEVITDCINESGRRNMQHTYRPATCDELLNYKTLEIWHWSELHPTTYGLMTAQGQGVSCPECLKLGNAHWSYIPTGWDDAIVGKYFFIREAAPAPVLRLVEVQEGKLRYMKLVEANQ